MRCILIDPFKNEVSAREIPDTLAAKQQLVGGFIAVGARRANGDVLLVDEEGHQKEIERAFFLDGRLLLGRGLLVGRETQSGRFSDTKSALAEVAEAVGLDVVESPDGKAPA